jgi:hypothetical protein
MTALGPGERHTDDAQEAGGLANRLKSSFRGSYSNGLMLPALAAGRTVTAFGQVSAVAL